MNKNILFYLLFLCLPIISLNSHINNLTDTNFFKVTSKDKQVLVYYIPAPPAQMADKQVYAEKAWHAFHDSTFKFKQLLDEAHTAQLPVVIVMPENYKKIATTSLQAPWLEGARVALSWASAYFRFKELGNIDVRVITFSDKDTLSQEQLTDAVTYVLTQKFDDTMHKSPETQMQNRIYSLQDIAPTHIQADITAYIFPETTDHTHTATVIRSKLTEDATRKRVLVTGGAGFLGSHIVIALINQGYQVLVCDNLFCSSYSNLASVEHNKNFEFHTLDISKPFDVEGKLDMIMHLASVPSPEYYYAKPRETLLAGLQGTKNTLDLAIKKSARYLFSSTSEVYGDPEVNPQPEDYAGNVNPIGKRSQYDQSKRGAETLIKLYFDTYALDARIVRIFNTYGPHMNLHDGRVVTNFIKALLDNQPITIYGSGKQTRSFAYASDTVDGIIKVFQSEAVTMLPTLEQRIFNVGNPYEFTINQLADKANMLSEKYFARKAAISRIAQPDSDDPKVRKPDIRRAQKTVGYNPVVQLEEGLEKTLRYFLNLA